MQTNNNNGKIAAMLAYLLLIGPIIAFFINFDNKNKFAYFHIRQALGLSITFFIMAHFIGYFDSIMISGAFFLFFFILWVYGFSSALSNKTTPIPLLGKQFQKLFSMIGEGA